MHIAPFERQADVSNAAAALLTRLDTITTEEFGLGAERPEREALRATLDPRRLGGSRHPLADNAIETLKELRDKAIAARDAAERTLDDPDLPRGRLPVLSRISGHECRAVHLRLAIEALGGTVEDATFETQQLIVREMSMPELRAAA